MKGRSISWGKSLILPGGRSILAFWGILSFIFNISGQETDPLSRMSFTGTTGKVLSKEAAYSSLSGPIFTGKKLGCFAGAFAEQHYGLKELQVWGGGLSYHTPRAGIGVAYAGSVYDGRGIQQVSTSAMLKRKAVYGSAQLNFQKQHWCLESPPGYFVFSALAFAVNLKGGVILGCLWQSPEEWLHPNPSITPAKGLIACEMAWKPDEKVSLGFQIAKGLMGVSCAAEISMRSHAGWEIGAGVNSRTSLYQVHLILPLYRLRWRIAISHHKLLGASPATDFSFPLSGFSRQHEKK